MESGTAEEAKLLTFMKDSSVATLLIVIAIGWFTAKLIFRKRKNLPPAIRGRKPLLGNLLQLKKARPHYLFTEWAQTYGPIFRFKAGMKNVVVCSSPDLFKEVPIHYGRFTSKTGRKMLGINVRFINWACSSFEPLSDGRNAFMVTVTKFDSISKRKLTTSFAALAKGFIVMADYSPTYRSHKKHYVTHLLGPNPQKANRSLREEEIFNMLDRIFKAVPSEGKIVNMKAALRDMLIAFGMRQTLGFTVETVHAPELGYLTKEQFRQYLLFDSLGLATKMDWRDFWPIFRWVPNYKLEREIERTVTRRLLVMKELIKMYKKHVSVNGPTGGYCDSVFADNPFSTERELVTGSLEPIIESLDTTSITTEWILFELAKKPEIQERLHEEIKSVAGNSMMNEDDIPHLPLMEAIIKETLRKHPPLPVMPPRLVEEDITIGGYDIPKGWEIVLNVWGIGMDKKTWSNPEVWDPDRCLNNPSLDMGFQNFKIAPFGGGKRRCAGIAQAMVVISLLVGTLVQHFEFALGPADLANMGVKDEGLSTVTTHKATPLEAILKPRVGKLLPQKTIRRSQT